jgi:hypothetical protein
MFVSCRVFVLSDRGLCDGLIPLPEESYRLWCVSECDQVTIKTLYTYCEQVGRRGKDYETKQHGIWKFISAFTGVHTLGSVVSCTIPTHFSLRIYFNTILSSTPHTILRTPEGNRTRVPFLVMEHGWNETDRGKPKYSGKNLSQCHFVHHKSHMD